MFWAFTQSVDFSLICQNIVAHWIHRL